MRRTFGAASPRAPHRIVAGLVAAALTSLGAGRAMAAPPAPSSARRVHVLHMAASQPYPYEAIKLTKALESRVSNLPSARLVNANIALFEALDTAKCGTLFVERMLGRGAGRGSPLDAEAGKLIDAACQKKIAAVLSTPPAERYLWGWLYTASDGRPAVSMNLWQKGDASLQVTLPYDPSSPERTAERVVLRLLEAERVGDVKLVAARPLRGQLYVDGVAQGDYTPEHAEMTLVAGEHVFEVRHEGRTRARSASQVVVGKTTEVPLVEQVEAPRALPAAGPGAPAASPAQGKATPAKRAPSVLPWVAGGVGAAGLVGAGVFFALRQNERADLRDACAGSQCLPEQKSAIDRGNRYDAFALASLGVGVAGVGLATYFFLNERAAPTTATRGPRTAVSVSPLRGGANVGLSGEF
jgi:hypothetical protein